VNRRSGGDGGLSIREVYRAFGPYLRPHHPRFVLAAVLVLAGTATSLLKPWPLKYLFDRVLVPEATRGGDAGQVQLVLLGIVGALALIALIDSALSFARSYVLTGLGVTVSTTVRSHLYEHLHRLSLRYHERQRTGELLTRVTSDVDKVQSIITTTVIEAAANAVTLVGMLVVMSALDWQLSLVMVLLLPLLVVVVQRFRRQIKRVEGDVRGSEGDLVSTAQEALSAMKLVKAYGREEYEATRFRQQAHDNLALQLRVLRVAGGFGIVLDMVTACTLAALVWLGAQRVLSGQLSPGDLIVFTAYLRDFVSPTRSLSKLPAQLSKASVRADKIVDVLLHEPDVVQPADAIRAPRLSGRLELRSASFGYEPSRPVLHDIDLDIRAGETLAVVGVTGAGKSTLLGLLCRLYDPDSGVICADGQDIRHFTLASYQSQLAVVLQHSMLFRASVKDNIAYGRPDASDEEIRTAARIANADDFITQLPDGYDTVVGERGDTLSGGQRQRIAIARALVRDPRLLLLDEPTTGLDAHSERDVLHALGRAMKGRSTMLISHQLSAVVRADRIVVLDNGRIVEQGTHDELVALHGRYAELARLQGLVSTTPPLTTVSTAGRTMTSAPRPTDDQLRSPPMVRAHGRLPQDDVDLSQLIPLLERSFGFGRWRSWRRTPRGKSNATYFVDTQDAGPIVLRRSHAAKTVAAARFEATLLNHLGAQGYPAPPVLRATDDDVLVEAGGVVHMAFGLLPGGNYDPQSPVHLQQAAHGLARYHQAISSLSLLDVPAASPALAVVGEVGRLRIDGVVSLCGDHLDQDQRQRLLASATYLKDEMVLLAAELAEVSDELSLAVVHGSYGPSALLFDGGRLTGVVDFDRAAYDLLGFDLAYALKALCRTGADQPGYRVGMDSSRCRAFLAAYSQESALPPQEVAALPLFFRAQRLIKVVKKCDNLLAKQAVAPQRHNEALKLATLLEREEQRLRWLRVHGDRMVDAGTG
jgi:ATP-binding cassette subfamily B protein